MPGSNSSGAPNTRDYNLGRGRILLAALDALTGLPDANGFRDLGNAPEFTMTVDVEDLRHQSSRDCVKFTDKRFIISQEVGLGFQVDELNFENWSDFLSGSQLVYDNPHDATIADAVISAAVHLGAWYELRNVAGERVYALDASGLVYTIEMDDVVDVLLVEGTDYEINEKLGLIRFLPTAVNIAEGDGALFNITTAATGLNIRDLDEVAALQRAEVSGALLFISENAGDCGQQVEFRYHKVSLTADGEVSLIGDEVSTLNFAGVAEKNALVADLSKVLTVRTYDMKA